MQFVDQHDIQDLLRIKPSGDLFLSVFLSTSVEEKNKRETKIFLKKKINDQERMLDTPEQHAEFQENVARIERFLDEELEREARGVAIFCSARRDFFRAFQMSVRLANRFVIADAPHIAPLAQVIEGNQHHSVVLFDSNHGRIMSVYLWKVVREESLSEEVPGKTKMGGWSQMRYQRHRAEAVHHFLKDLCESLDRFVERERPRDIILLGQERTVSEFRNLLPPHLARLVTFTEHMDTETSSQEVVRHLRPILEKEQAKEAKALIERLHDRIREDYLAVGGLEETLLVLQEGRVDTLVMNSGRARQGLRCNGCSFLFAGNSNDCTYCGESLSDVELNEHIVEVAERHGARIEFVKTPHPTLDERLEGIGAFLKF